MVQNSMVFCFQKTAALNSLPSVINATSFKPDCFSTDPNEHQSEDCLYLNVWLPADATPPLPVMVWIHGGGFITGSSNGPPGTVLAAERQVIVVSPNYRLGAFGFLSTESEDSPGNYGLWDQHTALQWVRDHITAFGGDPQTVTILGESAGGKSVSFQVVSPYSGHLFQRAIMQSGTVLCPTALQWKPLQTAVRLARYLGCPSGNRKDLLMQCLRQRSVRKGFSDRLGVRSPVDDDVIRKLIDFGWAPVKDGDFVPHLYHPDGTPTPLSPTFTGSLMLGVNNNEGALLKIWRIPVASSLDRDIEHKLHDPSFLTDQFLPAVLAQMFKTLPEDTPSFRAASQEAECFYRDWNGNPNVITARDLYSQFGDQAYVCPTFRFLEQWLNSSQPRSPVYVYVFDNYPGAEHGEGLEGMKHGDDVLYTFGTIEQTMESRRATWDVARSEFTLGQNFRKLLTNFAKSGNPASPAPIDAEWPTWPTYDLRQQKYLAVSSTPKVSDHYRGKYMTLWNHLVPNLVTGVTGNVTPLPSCADEKLIG